MIALEDEDFDGHISIADLYALIRRVDHVFFYFNAGHAGVVDTLESVSRTCH